jgi:membrane associated rhomboid family serine protease
MFIPLYDYNALRTIRTPVVTRTLIAVSVIVFVVFESGLVLDAQMASVGAFGVIPAEFHLGAGLRSELAVIPEPLTLVTYMFLHGGWMHLIGNMLFLWVFGDNVEDAMGHLRFIMFYLMCGIFAAVVHSWIMPNSDLPLIGASGAVAGIISAYLILHPKVKVWVLALWRIPIKITAYWALGFWIAMQFAYLVFDTDESVAWGAHIGGLAAGAVLILFMRRRGVLLFDRTRGGA